MRVDASVSTSLPVAPAPGGARAVDSGRQEASLLAKAPVVQTQSVVNLATPVDETLARSGSAQEELTQAAEIMQSKVRLSAPELNFSVDEESGRMVIKVTDTATNELIRQIPSEEALKLNKELDRLGTLLNNTI